MLFWAWAFLFSPFLFFALFFGPECNRLRLMGTGIRYSESPCPKAYASLGFGVPPSDRGPNRPPLALSPSPSRRLRLRWSQERLFWLRGLQPALSAPRSGAVAFWVRFASPPGTRLFRIFGAAQAFSPSAIGALLASAPAAPSGGRPSPRPPFTPLPPPIQGLTPYIVNKYCTFSRCATLTVRYCNTAPYLHLSLHFASFSALLSIKRGNYLTPAMSNSFLSISNATAPSAEPAFVSAYGQRPGRSMPAGSLVGTARSFYFGV